MTNAEAEYELLSKKSEQAKFAIPLGAELPEHLQLALERLQETDRIRLIDVDRIAAAPQTLMRIFKVTERGFYHLDVISKSLEKKGKV